jgi:hypothetical protein
MTKEQIDKAIQEYKETHSGVSDEAAAFAQNYKCSFNPNHAIRQLVGDKMPTITWLSTLSPRLLRRLEQFAHRFSCL